MFIGRSIQLEQLDRLWSKRVPSLVTCRGRRRIGKSTLIVEFAKRSHARLIKLEGLRPKKGMTNADQLAFFVSKLAQQTRCERSLVPDWLAAFDLLNRQIDGRERTVVLLDEISWMACFDNTFPEVLKNAWDDLFKSHPRLIVVLCGSVSHWIKENIVENRAYVGRRSLDIVVPELSLRECLGFWGRHVSRTDTREIVDILSVTGGVPRYLEEIDFALSAEENIRRLCFTPKSILREEFDDMFNDVITTKPLFAGKVLRTFVLGPKSAAEVAETLGISKGGDVSKAIDILLESGFLAEESRRNPETGEVMRERRFRLRDNYVRFYLKFIERHKETVDTGAFTFASLDELDGMDAVRGLAFENLIVNNYRELLPFLHLNGALLTSAAPYRRRPSKGVRGKPGCQVDLLIQTRRSMWIVEIKRKREIGRDVIDEVDSKVRAIVRPAGCSVKTALVYDGQLSPVAATDGYFDAIVPIRQLLGLEGTEED